MHLRPSKPQQIRQRLTTTHNPRLIRRLRAYKTLPTIWPLLLTIPMVLPRVRDSKGRDSRDKEKGRARVRVDKDRDKVDKVDKVKDRMAVVRQIKVMAKKN